MRVVVMGGGVVGVTAAYELQKDGHEVVLIERNSAVGDETSWGNAGMIAPGHSFAWSSPTAPFVLLKSLFSKNQALRFTPSADPRLWTWSLQFLAQCTESRAARNTLRKHRLAGYSQSVLQETLKSESIEYDRNARGILYFYRSQASLDRGVAHMKILADDGQQMRTLSRAEVIALEPSLASAQHKIAGGIYCPTDETGDCSKFTKALAEICKARGAEFLTGQSVEKLETSGDRVTEIRTSSGRLKADLYVMALGNQSPLLARTIGERLPIYPVKGYSLTLPIGGNHTPPTVGAVDEDNLIAYSRMGERLRVTATADFAGYNAQYQPSDFAVMTRKIQDILPGGADYTRPQYWAGLRPMTPEGTPVMGTGRLKNLFFNTGHGHVGWTMSCGAARVTRDLIAGRKPAIPLDGMTLQ